MNEIHESGVIRGRFINRTDPGDANQYLIVRLDRHRGGLPGGTCVVRIPQHVHGGRTEDMIVDRPHHHSRLSRGVPGSAAAHGGRPPAPGPGQSSGSRRGGGTVGSPAPLCPGAAPPPTQPAPGRGTLGTDWTRDPPGAPQWGGGAPPGTLRGPPSRRRRNLLRTPLCIRRQRGAKRQLDPDPPYARMSSPVCGPPVRREASSLIVRKKTANGAPRRVGRLPRAGLPPGGPAPGRCLGRPGRY